MLLYSHAKPQVFRLLPAALKLRTASTSNWRTGHEHILSAVAIPGNGSRHFQKYRRIKLSTGVSYLVEILQTSWYSKALNMTKRWRFVYFTALLNEAFGSQTESVPISRLRTVGGEDGTSFFFIQGLFSCLSLGSHCPFSCLCWHNFNQQMTSQWEMTSHFARGIKVITTAHADEGSWTLSQNVLKS